MTLLVSPGWYKHDHRCPGSPLMSDSKDLQCGGAGVGVGGLSAIKSVYMSPLFFFIYCSFCCCYGFKYNFKVYAGGSGWGGQGGGGQQEAITSGFCHRFHSVLTSHHQRRRQQHCVKL